MTAATTDPPPRLWEALAWTVPQAVFAWLCWTAVDYASPFGLIAVGVLVGTTLCLAGNLGPAAVRRGHPGGWQLMAALNLIGVAVVYCLPDRTRTLPRGFPIEPLPATPVPAAGGSPRIVGSSAPVLGDPGDPGVRGLPPAAGIVPVEAKP